MTFANVTAISIPSGDVSKITETNSGRVLWEKTTQQEALPKLRIKRGNAYVTYYVPKTGDVLEAVYYFTPNNQPPYEVKATDVVWKLGAWTNVMNHGEMICYGSTTMTLSATTGASVKLTKVDLSNVPQSDSLTRCLCPLTAISTIYKDDDGAFPYPHYTERYLKGSMSFERG